MGISQRNCLKEHTVFWKIYFDSYGYLIYILSLYDQLDSRRFRRKFETYEDKEIYKNV